MSQRARIKRHGIHYTPPELARFLCEQVTERLTFGGPTTILDPACGDGELLAAIVECTPRAARKHLRLVGYETDVGALESARARLEQSGVHEVDLRLDDFLLSMGAGDQRSLFEPGTTEKFDAIVSNPPYVRTQVLGARKAQQLADRFELSGRVDLYHAFIKAMSWSLKPRGILGLLTSNRFLTIRSGSAVRSLLRRRLALEAIYDLGDTKLFAAAVLPAIVIARNDAPDENSACIFDRVYEHSATASTVPREYPSVLEAIKDRSFSGVASTPSGRFCIERGHLASAKNDDQVWSLSTPGYRQWLATVKRHTSCHFEDVAHIRVGIKTTADKVFIRDAWNDLPVKETPEAELLHPLLTHFEAGRWQAVEPGPHKAILYPHRSEDGRRVPIDLREYPRAKRYFERHEELLRAREYVTSSGRQWYEIWVPHQPGDWTKPKVVFPDISREPKFFFDGSGLLVNGDCYWITLRAGQPDAWLMLMLAVANSSFIGKYYDLTFHNKLYSGRRRFQTQFVRGFPLPRLEGDLAREIIGRTESLANGADPEPNADGAEEELDRLVWQAFGLTKEVDEKTTTQRLPTQSNRSAHVRVER